MVKKIQYLILVFFPFCLCTSFSGDVFFPAGAIRTIVIDPGHGGKDPGCLGAIHKEKDIALAVGLKLGKYLEQNFKDVKVIYTRTTDVFVELEDRAQIANKAKADLFISIHCNAAGKPVLVKDAKTGKMRPKMYKNRKGKLIPVETANPVPYGTETYVMGIKNEEGKMKVATRENSAIFLEEDYEKKYGGFDPESEETYIIMSNYTSAYVIQSANLAMKFQEEYERKAGRINKGVHRQSIWVLWRTSMPSILTEIGYLTNPLEETFLGSEKGQEYLAKAMFRGVRRYKDEMEGRKKEYNDEFENQPPLENENLVAGNSPAKKTEEAPEDTSATEEEEDETPAEIPKPEPVKKDSGIKVAVQLSKDTETATVKTKVDDGRYKNIEVREVQKTKKEDTVVSANAIAEKYRNERIDAATDKKVISEKLASENVVLKKEAVVFKVQFASSDMALDLKQEKFAAVKDADFYKAGPVLKYTSGNFVTIKDAAAHQAFLREKGFKDCFVVAFKNNQRIDMAEARKLVESK